MELCQLTHLDCTQPVGGHAQSAHATQPIHCSATLSATQVCDKGMELVTQRQATQLFIHDDEDSITQLLICQASPKQRRHVASSHKRNTHGYSDDVMTQNTQISRALQPHSKHHCTLFGPKHAHATQAIHDHQPAFDGADPAQQTQHTQYNGAEGCKPRDLVDCNADVSHPVTNSTHKTQRIKQQGSAAVSNTVPPQSTRVTCTQSIPARAGQQGAVSDVSRAQCACTQRASTQQLDMPNAGQSGGSQRRGDTTCTPHEAHCMLTNVVSTQLVHALHAPAPAFNTSPKLHVPSTSSLPSAHLPVHQLVRHVEAQLQSADAPPPCTRHPYAFLAVSTSQIPTLEVFTSPQPTPQAEYLRQQFVEVAADVENVHMGLLQGVPEMGLASCILTEDLRELADVQHQSLMCPDTQKYAGGWEITLWRARQQLNIDTWNFGDTDFPRNIDAHDVDSRDDVSLCSMSSSEVANHVRDEQEVKRLLRSVVLGGYDEDAVDVRGRGVEYDVCMTQRINGQQVESGAGQNTQQDSKCANPGCFETQKGWCSGCQKGPQVGQRATPAGKRATRTTHCAPKLVDQASQQQSTCAQKERSKGQLVNSKHPETTPPNAINRTSVCLVANSLESSQKVRAQHSELPAQHGRQHVQRPAQHVQHEGQLHGQVGDDGVGSGGRGPDERGCHVGQHVQDGKNEQEAVQQCSAVKQCDGQAGVPVVVVSQSSPPAEVEPCGGVVDGAQHVRYVRGQNGAAVSGVTKKVAEPEGGGLAGHGHPQKDVLEGEGVLDAAGIQPRAGLVVAQSCEDADKVSNDDADCARDQSVGVGLGGVQGDVADMDDDAACFPSIIYDTPQLPGDVSVPASLASAQQNSLQLPGKLLDTNMVPSTYPHNPVQSIATSASNHTYASSASAKPLQSSSERCAPKLQARAPPSPDTARRCREEQRQAALKRAFRRQKHARMVREAKLEAQKEQQDHQQGECQQVHQYETCLQQKQQTETCQHKQIQQQALYRNATPTGNEHQVRMQKLSGQQVSGQQVGSQRGTSIQDQSKTEMDNKENWTQLIDEVHDNREMQDNKEKLDTEVRRGTEEQGNREQDNKEQDNQEQDNKERTVQVGKDHQSRSAMLTISQQQDNTLPPQNNTTQVQGTTQSVTQQQQVPVVCGGVAQQLDPCHMVAQQQQGVRSGKKLQEATKLTFDEQAPDAEILVPDISKRGDDNTHQMAGHDQQLPVTDQQVPARAQQVQENGYSDVQPADHAPAARGPVQHTQSPKECPEAPTKDNIAKRRNDYAVRQDSAVEECDDVVGCAHGLRNDMADDDVAQLTMYTSATPWPDSMRCLPAIAQVNHEPKWRQMEKPRIKQQPIAVAIPTVHDPCPLQLADDQAHSKSVTNDHVHSVWSVSSGTQQTKSRDQAPTAGNHKPPISTSLSNRPAPRKPLSKRQRSGKSPPFWREGFGGRHVFGGRSARGVGQGQQIKDKLEKLRNLVTCKQENVRVGKHGAGGGAGKSTMAGVAVSVKHANCITRDTVSGVLNTKASVKPCPSTVDRVNIPTGVHGKHSGQNGCEQNSVQKNIVAQKGTSTWYTLHAHEPSGTSPSIPKRPRSHRSCSKNLAADQFVAATVAPDGAEQTRAQNKRRRAQRHGTTTRAEGVREVVCEQPKPMRKLIRSGTIVGPRRGPRLQKRLQNQQCEEQGLALRRGGDDGNGGMLCSGVDACGGSTGRRQCIDTSDDDSDVSYNVSATQASDQYDEDEEHASGACETLHTVRGVATAAKRVSPRKRADHEQGLTARPLRCRKRAYRLLDSQFTQEWEVQYQDTACARGLHVHGVRVTNHMHGIAHISGSECRPRADHVPSNVKPKKFRALNALCLPKDGTGEPCSSPCFDKKAAQCSTAANALDCDAQETTNSVRADLEVRKGQSKQATSPTGPIGHIQKAQNRSNNSSQQKSLQCNNSTYQQQQQCNNSTHLHASSCGVSTPNAVLRNDDVACRGRPSTSPSPDVNRPTSMGQLRTTRTDSQETVPVPKNLQLRSGLQRAHAAPAVRDMTVNLGTNGTAQGGVFQEMHEPRNVLVPRTVPVPDCRPTCAPRDDRTGSGFNEHIPDHSDGNQQTGCTAIQSSHLSSRVVRQKLVDQEYVVPSTGINTCRQVDLCVVPVNGVFNQGNEQESGSRAKCSVEQLGHELCNNADELQRDGVGDGVTVGSGDCSLCTVDRDLKDVCVQWVCDELMEPPVRRGKRRNCSGLQHVLKTCRVQLVSDVCMGVNHTEKCDQGQPRQCTNIPRNHGVYQQSGEQLSVVTIGDAVDNPRNNIRNELRNSTRSNPQLTHACVGDHDHQPVVVQPKPRAQLPSIDAAACAAVPCNHAHHGDSVLRAMDDSQQGECVSDSEGSLCPPSPSTCPQTCAPLTPTSAEPAYFSCAPRTPTDPMPCPTVLQCTATRQRPPAHCGPLSPLCTHVHATSSSTPCPSFTTAAGAVLTPQFTHQAPRSARQFAAANRKFVDHVHYSVSHTMQAGRVGAARGRERGLGGVPGPRSLSQSTCTWCGAAVDSDCTHVELSREGHEDHVHRSTVPNEKISTAQATFVQCQGVLKAGDAVLLPPTSDHEPPIVARLEAAWVETLTHGRAKLLGRFTRYYYPQDTPFDSLFQRENEAGKGEVAFASEDRFRGQYGTSGGFNPKKPQKPRAGSFVQQQLFASNHVDVMVPLVQIIGRVSVCEGGGRGCKCGSQYLCRYLYNHETSQLELMQ